LKFVAIHTPYKENRKPAATRQTTVMSQHKAANSGLRRSALVAQSLSVIERTSQFLNPKDKRWTNCLSGPNHCAFRQHTVDGKSFYLNHDKRDDGNG